MSRASGCKGVKIFLKGTSINYSVFDLWELIEVSFMPLRELMFNHLTDGLNVCVVKFMLGNSYKSK